MSALVTIATYANISELSIARGRLEADGIECFVQDEFTVQVYNFYDQAIGGVKLQVRQEDAETAKRILIETGFLSESSKNDYVSGLAGKIARWSTKLQLLVTKIEIWSAKLPFLGHLDIYKRLAYLVAALSVVAVAVSFMLLHKSDFELINNKAWCLYQVEYKFDVLEPNTIEEFGSIYIYGECVEKAKFYKSGTVVFPGFNSKSIRGTWRFADGKMYIQDVDTLSEVLNGTYDVDISGRDFTLTNSNTTITLYK